MNKIKIWLCVIAWAVVTVAVIIAVIITESPSCLWAFVIPALVTSDIDLTNISFKADN